MTLSERKIWHLPLILLLVLWLGGCSMQYEGEEPALQTGDLNLILNIHTGDANNGLTRAEIDEKRVFEQATLERELMKTLRVIIVNQYNGTIVHNDYNILPEASSFKDGLKYEVDFDTKYKVYLIANEEGIPNHSQIFSKSVIDKDLQYKDDYLETQVIEIAEAGQPIIDSYKQDLAIPMTEIFEVETDPKPKELTGNNEVIQEETFFITRAASKFSFYFFVADGFDSSDSNNEQLEIKQIKINGLGQNEYLFPFETEYSPTKKSDKTEVKRDITSFQVPSENNGIGEFVFDLPTPFKLSELPKKPIGFDSNNPTDKLNTDQIRQHTPEIYFPESKGYINGNEFECTISYDGVNYLEPVRLPNLPHRLPRNTHVVVIITLKYNSLEATVDIQPFGEIILKPDFGLMRDENGDLMFYPTAYGDKYDKEGLTSLPESLRNYVTKRGIQYDPEKYPVDLIPEEGDYFSIDLGLDGSLYSEDTRVYLKDYDGDEVLSNYGEKDENSDDCLARKIRHKSGTTTEEVYKDFQGEIRILHNADHSSVVKDRDDVLIFKYFTDLPDMDPKKMIRFKVESYEVTDSGHTFWVISSEDKVQKGEPVIVEIKGEVWDEVNQEYVVGVIRKEKRTIYTVTYYLKQYDQNGYIENPPEKTIVTEETTYETVE